MSRVKEILIGLLVGPILAIFFLLMLCYVLLKRLFGRRLDKIEAGEVLRREIARIRGMPLSELRQNFTAGDDVNNDLGKEYLRLGGKVCADSGIVYTVNFMGYWSEANENEIEIQAEIHDDGASMFSPLRDAFIYQAVSEGEGESNCSSGALT